MQNSLQVTEPQSPGSDSDGTDQVHDQRIINPTKFVSIADSLEKREHSRFITSQIPTDLSIQVQEITFNVHKHTLVLKCGYIGRLELQPSISNYGYNLKLENFPGGSETFEIILKFCYGLPVDLNPNNIASLRCASEFLEMTEEFEDGNLITKTEAFLAFVVLCSWKDAITVLKSCEALSPWAENLQIVRRCCDSLAWKASRKNSSTGDAVHEEGWWFDDIAILRIDHFRRIITAIRAKGTTPEIIGKCIMNYAERWLPGMVMETGGVRGYGHGKNELQFSICSQEEEGGIAHSKEQKAIIESLISMLPPQQEAVSCKFLLQMLKMAMVYSATPALISELEKRVGMMLEDASVNDLLIPSYKNFDERKLTNSPEQCTMHDIDVVQRIVEYFLMHEQQQQQQQQKSGKCNIKNVRTCHDGLYRAIDTYLKTNRLLSEHDRRRLCKIMNCEKLSLDARMHAAQNDRLPLRTIVQVLLSEQLKMREEMLNKNGNTSEPERNQSSTNMEIKTMKAEIENMKTKMEALQSDYSELQQEYGKLCNKPKNASGWASIGWRKIRNSFHAKIDGDETGDGQQRPNPARKRSFKRRSSIF
ncbi:BTB/POZ domain-containing protein DOT3-like isoform X2 [Quercus robur]|uniref:BTB/POZ domain-containing protein DOT3-like isoform X2 n=1 Tax=Quercus robur TaxID=38942 RepID=UPI0021621B09|nr:BTB/POZ domain-containing protein DOT3-like isoform X2 [Quercus robur]